MNVAVMLLCIGLIDLVRPVLDSYRARVAPKLSTNTHNRQGQTTSGRLVEFWARHPRWLDLSVWLLVAATPTSVALGMHFAFGLAWLPTGVAVGLAWLWHTIMMGLPVTGREVKRIWPAVPLALILAVLFAYDTSAPTVPSWLPVAAPSTYSTVLAALGVGAVLTRTSNIIVGRVLDRLSPATSKGQKGGKEQLPASPPREHEETSTSTGPDERPAASPVNCADGGGAPGRPSGSRTGTASHPRRTTALTHTIRAWTVGLHVAAIAPSTPAPDEDEMGGRRGKRKPGPDPRPPTVPMVQSSATTASGDQPSGEAQRESEAAPEDASGGVDPLGGGKVIGVFERFLVVGATLAGAYPIVAGLLAAKGIVRFPEISKDDEHGGKAEAFLVGSLLSWSVAWLGAIYISAAQT